MGKWGIWTGHKWGGDRGARGVDSSWPMGHPSLYPHSGTGSLKNLPAIPTSNHGFAQPSQPCRELQDPLARVRAAVDL